MYNVTEQFHEAVFQNSPATRALFQFADGTIFTNEDIHVTSGIKLMEAVNFEEELTIGSCSSSTLDATIMNFHGLLSGFGFGECEVSLGVKTGTDVYIPDIANVTAIKNYGTGEQETYTGHASVPYLRTNGTAASQQPPFAVDAIILYEENVLCFSLEGNVWLMPGGTLPVCQSEFMKERYKAWAKAQIGRSFANGILYEFSTSGAIEKYEYAKLGTFLFNTPQKRNTNLITITAYDKMTLFDVDADEFWAGITYPITVGQIFQQLCTFVGVPRATSSFINSSWTITSNPIKREKLIAKEILRWIAEAACSFARMSRDGELELAWFDTQDISIPMTQCFSVDPAEYEVAQIDKLEILNSEVNLGTVVGTGANSYEILNNPFLFSAMDAEVRALGMPIYARLSAFPRFTPIVANVTCNWSVQAGDIVSVTFDDKTYLLPIYCQTITWKGDARVIYESTGKERRPIMSAENRYVYTQEKAMAETVRQGEAYNHTTITYENGVVTKATIDGVDIEVRQNGQEGFALYANDQYLGGVRIINGKAAMVGNVITNDISGACWAEIGEVVSDGIAWPGLLVYNSGYSATVPVLRLIALDDGHVALRRLGNSNGVELWSDGSVSISGSSGRERLNIDADGGFVVRDNSDRIQMYLAQSDSYIRYAGTTNHAIGADSTGPYYVKDNVKTYF